ncbi:MAG: chemotaxis protein CheA [Bacteroidales bacterium]|nr:chemotaxis protein CheA [Candidatus Latescibacterota bacterium]
MSKDTVSVDDRSASVVTDSDRDLVFLQEIVEEISGSIVMTDIDYPDTLEDLSGIFNKIDELDLADSADSIVEPIKLCHSILQDVIDRKTRDGNKDLKDISESIANLQRKLDLLIRPFNGDPEIDTIDKDAVTSRESDGPEDGEDISVLEDDSGQGSDPLVLPDWVDDSMMAEFVDTQRTQLDDIEEMLLDMDGEDEDSKKRLLGPLHTMKGEAGVVGLDGLSRLYHLLEDVVEAETDHERLLDILLKSKDWISRAFESYLSGRKPEQSFEELISEIESSVECPADRPEVMENEDPDESVTDSETPDEIVDLFEVEEDLAEEVTLQDIDSDTSAPDVELSDDVVAEPVDRDEETVELIVDFLEESEEGVASCEELLMKVESGDADSETINALFRVFHTIKGVSGFLDLKFMQALAHQTETMFSMVRDEIIVFDGEYVDIAFDATAMMRNMLTGLGEAVRKSMSTVSPEGFGILIARLKKATETKKDENSEESIVREESGIVENQAEEAGNDSAILAVETPEDIEISTDQDDIVDSRPEKDEPELQTEEVVTPVKDQKVTPPANSSRKPVHVKSSLRVDAEKLDKLVDMVGELVIAESMVVQSDEIMNLKSPSLMSKINRLDKISRDLQEIGTSLRMVPLKGVFQKMTRLVRDLARKSSKDVEMIVTGAETELDKSVVDRIGDPLVHMIRNAVDHGIESSTERKKVGKSEAGTVKLSAYHKSGNIYIEVEDDGKGLDRDAILAKAIERNLVSETDQPSDSEIFNIIFEPGFSTAKTVSDVSGRGVGMDVVKKNIMALRGKCDIQSESGKGTLFTIRLPLTLAIIDGLVIKVGNQRYIVPTMSVVSSFKPVPEDISVAMGHAEMVIRHDGLLPLFRLHRFFNVQGAMEEPSDALVMVVDDGEKKIGMLVDELLGQQQIVIKTMSGEMKGVPGISGSAVMPDGKVALIIDIGGLIKLAKQEGRKESG